jgi:ABC-type nitrate/sulfonate/bicarbonate transport system ATPase subunit
MTPVLELFQLSKSFGATTVVKDFNLNIAPGEFVTLIGHSGCGKSTVLSMVAGLTSITQGGMILSGKETTEPGPDRGVNQVYYTASRQERRELAEYYLHVVGLGHAMDQYPAQLSQGMRQRVGIARAFSLQPKMLLLDEPFGMLDSLTKMELQEVLLDLWRRNSLTTLMVTHDVDEAIFLSDRVVMMTDGPEAEVGDILTIPFERPRKRKEILTDPRYQDIRQHLLTFLNERSHIRPSKMKA